MDEIETAILDAWDRVRPVLELDEHELAKRLARRRCVGLRRVPRAWCLGVRASDTRMAAAVGLADGVARRSYAARPMPRAGPDVMAWYKWKGDEYIGYDWRRAESNPRIREEYERQLRVAERRRAKYRENRDTRGPRRTSQSHGSLH